MNLKAGKDLWIALAQLAAWVTGLVFQFVSTPARLRFNDDSAGSTTQFIQFVLTIVIGLLLLGFWKWCGPRHTRIWVIACIVSLIAAIGSFGAYTRLTNRWTCSYSTLPAVVIGKTYKPNAAAFARRIPDDSCTIMLRDFGENWQIWNEDEIEDRHMILGALFSLVVAAFSLAVMFLLQAWRCSRRRLPKV